MADNSTEILKTSDRERKLVNQTGGSWPQNSETPFPVPEDFEAMANEVREAVGGGSEGGNIRTTENKGPLARFRERVGRLAKRGGQKQ